MLMKPLFVLSTRSRATRLRFVASANFAALAGLSCLALVGAQSLAAGANTSPQWTQAANVRVPYQTPVTVHVKSEVSSSKAQPGDSVVLQVADDIVVNGYVVMARGADGLAEVESATPASANRSGALKLVFKWVRAVDGSKIGVTGEYNLAGRAPSGGANPATSTLSQGLQAASSTVTSSSGGTSGFANLIGQSGGLLGRLPAKGDDASIEPARTISIQVRNPAGVTIVSSLKPADDDLVK